MSSVCACVHACIRESVRSSRFYINLNISFIYKDITKFAGNVYGALNLKIFQLVSSNLHKSYMARKASLILILA